MKFLCGTSGNLRLESGHSKPQDYVVDVPESYQEDEIPYTTVLQNELGHNYIYVDLIALAGKRAEQDAIHNKYLLEVAEYNSKKQMNPVQRFAANMFGSALEGFAWSLIKPKLKSFFDKGDS